MKPSKKDKLNLLLLALIGSKAVAKKWWKSPNKAFDGRTPISLWKGSDNDQKTVATYLLQAVIR